MASPAPTAVAAGRRPGRSPPARGSAGPRARPPGPGPGSTSHCRRSLRGRAGGPVTPCQNGSSGTALSAAALVAAAVFLVAFLAPAAFFAPPAFLAPVVFLAA